MRRRWGGEAKESLSRLDTGAVGGMLAPLHFRLLLADLGRQRRRNHFQGHQAYLSLRSTATACGDFSTGHHGLSSAAWGRIRDARRPNRTRVSVPTRCLCLTVSHVVHSLPASSSATSPTRSSARLATSGIRRAVGAWCREHFSSQRETSALCEVHAYVAGQNR